MSPSPRRSGARTRSASALLAALALAGGLSACGDDDGGTATDPERQPYGTTSECTDDQGVRFYLGDA